MVWNPAGNGAMYSAESSQGARRSRPMPDQRVQVRNPADGGFFYWLFKFYSFASLCLFLLALASLPMLYVIVARMAPEPPDLAAFRRETELATRILASDGTVLTTLEEKRRSLVPVERMPKPLIQAFLAAEDRGFFEHGGVDFRGIIRATLANLRAGGVRQGGSTITQQVAKAYLSPERTIQRKLREVVLARRIEARYTKQEILYLYLNHIFLGSNAYGVKAAARVYFDKDLDQLSLAEMATLAGLVRAPSRYSPRRDLALATTRRNQVLKSMAEAKFIGQAQLKAAMAEPLALRSPPGDPMLWLVPHFAEHVRRELLARYGREQLYSAGWRVETPIDLSIQRLAQKHVQRVVTALDKRQGWRGPWMRLATPGEQKAFLEKVSKLYNLTHLRKGFIYPTLITRVAGSRAAGLIGPVPVDLPVGLMTWAAPYSRTNSENEQTTGSVRDVLHEGDVVWTISPPRWLRTRAWGQDLSRPTVMALHQVPRVEGALYSYDHQSGQIVAMVGGLDYDRSSFNRTVQACRQPGSTYKPVYFALALDGEEVSMGTILRDKPYEPEEGEEWNPQNIHGTIDGRVTMHMALVRSLNLPAIELLAKIGAKNVVPWARRLGFTTPIFADKALALGASCVHIDEMTRAFGTFVRGGSQRDPVYIRQIRDRDGNLVEDHSHIEDPLLDEADRLDRAYAWSNHVDPQVIDEKTAFLITKLLRDSVLYGIAARCQIIPIPTGGKSGTSSDTMDTWFVGFSGQWATTSWVGDDTYQRPLGEKEASYTSSTPIWANFMRAAVGNRPGRDLPLRRPPGLKSAVIDFQTGGLPTESTEKTVTIYFRPGTWAPASSDTDDVK